MRQVAAAAPARARFLLAQDPQLITCALDTALRAIFRQRTGSVEQTGAGGDLLPTARRER